MPIVENRGAERRAELERLVPGTSIEARVDRGAWAAMSQGAPGAWSWPRAAGTLALAALAGAAIYLTVFAEPAFLFALAIAYAFMFWRARVAHVEYLRRTTP
jgi:CHASE2 domain-containing sensor protein